MKAVEILPMPFNGEFFFFFSCKMIVVYATTYSANLQISTEKKVSQWPMGLDPKNVGIGLQPNRAIPVTGSYQCKLPLFHTPFWSLWEGLGWAGRWVWPCVLKIGPLVTWLIWTGLEEMWVFSCHATLPPFPQIILCGGDLWWHKLCWLKVCLLSSSWTGTVRVRDLRKHI